LWQNKDDVLILQNKESIDPPKTNQQIIRQPYTPFAQIIYPFIRPIFEPIFGPSMFQLRPLTGIPLALPLPSPYRYSYSLGNPSDVYPNQQIYYKKYLLYKKKYLQLKKEHNLE
jgi:hypothetical protein